MEAVAAPPAETHDGRIAMRVRIGVTGHRRLADEAALAGAVRRVLKLLADVFASTETTPVRFTVLSALAEGADRLVVREAPGALAPHAMELGAILPLEPDDYASDFPTEASRAEFHRYMEQAAWVLQTWRGPGGSRDEAYRRAGREIVDRSDVLIALWDGQPAHGPGGTGDIVEYAVRCGVAVLTVPTEEGTAGGRSPEVRDLTRGGPQRLRRAREALRRMRVYNADTPALTRLARSVGGNRVWSPDISDSAVHELFGTVAAWAMPHFLRAELRARRAQRVYHLLVDALFALAAIAVAAVGWQISFHPNHPRLALFETVTLVVLVVAFTIGRRARLHEAWIGYRSLAEAFRSSVFIATIGSGEGGLDGPPAGFRDEPWSQRAFTEAWGHRPAVFPERCDVAPLRALVAGAWVGDQIEYHERAAARAERRHRLFTYTVQAMLAVAIVLSILHAFEVFKDRPHAADLLELLAIALPGVSAALTGHREQRQYRINAERSRRTAERLRRLRRELQTAPDLPALRRFAGEAQTIMVEENRDWFGVAELQDLEVSL